MWKESMGDFNQKGKDLVDKDEGMEKEHVAEWCQERACSRIQGRVRHTIPVDSPRETLSNSIRQCR